MIGRNYGLDILRAIAILLVLSSHALFFVIQTFPQHENIKLISYFFGFWGVELFFVLSGFLIGKIIKELAALDSNYWIITFWIRRWFRTIPCYFLFLFLNVVWYYHIYETLPKFLFNYLIFAQNLAWEHPDFFPEAWSLSIEECFYLIFPILIIILISCGLKPKIACLISGAILLIFSTILRLVFVINEPLLTWDLGVRKIVIFRFDALMYGVFLTFFIDQIRLAKQQKMLFLVGLAALLVSMTAYFSLDHNRSYFLKTIGFSITSVGFILIMPYMLDFRLGERNYFSGFFRKTALWSYSIYLSNFLIYSIIQNFIFSKYYADQQDKVFVLCILCIMLLFFSCYLVSAITYRMYEFPFMNLREPAIMWIKNRFGAVLA